MLILVVGPSGAGKDTLLDGARVALGDDPRFRFATREITRAAAAGGEAHVEVSRAAWEARSSAGAYALWWEAHGLGYGIPVDIVGDLAAGRVVVASVSRAVLAVADAQFRARVLVITAPALALARRLVARGRESTADMMARLRREVALPEGLDVVTVVNDGTIAAGVAKVVAVLLEAADERA